jgi:hypothetical protein
MAVCARDGDKKNARRVIGGRFGINPDLIWN